MPTETNPNQTRNIIIGIIILAVLGAGAWWYMQKGSYILPLAEGDTVSSWDFQGASEGNAQLEEQARGEIDRLEGLLGGDQSGLNDDPTDYSLHVSIASQYESLGDGAKARKYFEKALAIDSTKTGLAWHNLASLMSRLGAKNTARVAYAKAAESQSQAVGYHLARIQFLMDAFASDSGAVDGAFSEAEKALGENASILQLQAVWLEESGRTDEAIAALEKMKPLMPQDAQTVIEAEITRLKAL